MVRTAQNLFLLIIALILLAPACTSSDPYIFDAHEFNRGSLNFDKISKDLKSLKICHKKGVTERKQIIKIAQQKCSEYGKIARFEKQDFLHCPILTPSGAMFLCEKP